MSYHGFSPISDAVLLANLKRLVSAMAAAGWRPIAIGRNLEGEVANYNRSHVPKLLLGQLNRFLWEHNLPTIAGNDHLPVR